jgi:hypothetical protein
MTTDGSRRRMLTKKADVNRETILVVEDHFDISALIRVFLENAAFESIRGTNPALLCCSRTSEFLR